MRSVFIHSLISAKPYTVLMLARISHLYPLRLHRKFKTMNVRRLVKTSSRRKFLFRPRSLLGTYRARFKLPRICTNILGSSTDISQSSDGEASTWPRV